MNKRRQFTGEFKQETANQVIERGYPIKEVTEHPGISDKTLYNWVNRFKTPQTQRSDQDALASENKWLQAELRRMTEERDILKIERSSYYAWLKVPKSARTRRNERLMATLKQLWMESDCVYGYRKLHADLQEMGIDCSPDKVARLCRKAGIKAQIGYKRRKGYYGGKLAIVADNHLDRQFTVDCPSQVWVTDITYIRTYEGWLYLAVVIDLYSLADR